MGVSVGAKDKVTTDQFLGGRLSVLQPSNGHRSGHDAVLLAASLPVTAKNLCELGTGVGVAMLCAAARLPDAQFTGLEIDPQLSALAQQNAQLNQLEDRISVVTADILSRPRHLAAASFDHVFFNPPYYNVGQVMPLEDPLKAQAHHQEADALDVWLRYAAYLLRAGGEITLIHRATQLVEIVSALAPRFGGVTICPIYPRPNSSAGRVIIRAKRDSRGPTKLASPLILQDEAGQPSSAAEKILRHAAALALSAVDG